ncbi:MAG: hypothetical protein M3388_18565 [Acidobacteriota bacterium]|nr:hypothetical protein [Acidobacteriota bacterium]
MINEIVGYIAIQNGLKEAKAFWLFLTLLKSNKPPEVQGRIITIRKPDVRINQLTAYSSEAPHTMVGIFFKNVFSDEIPRGSQIEW